MSAIKICAYCGRENADGVDRCGECGTAEFVVPAAVKPLAPQDVEQSAEPIELESDVPPDGEAALCTSCLFPNLTDSKWCKQCGAPMSGIVMFLFPDAARATGFAFRRAVETRPKFVVVCGIWVYFFPGFLFNMLGLLSVLAVGPRGFVGLAFFFLGFVGAAVCGSMVYRVTRNYFRFPKTTS